MDQIFLVVFRHGIEDEVNAHVKGILPLLLAAWSARVDPAAQLVPLPGTAKVIVAIDQRSRIAHRNAFQVRADHPPPADSFEQVVATHGRMTRRDSLELLLWKDLLHFSAQALIKAVAGLAQGVVG